ncbi:MAG TPA: tyrosine-type recombinase/integrase [Trebonia sp.]|nr:tyrosine-type recombinase/integrase [Trebonia sp.]
MSAPAAYGQFPDRLVIEMESGITVYPARGERGRWRAVWYENGQRQQCEAVTEDRLAAKLEKVAERLQAGAPNMTKPGAALIAWYLDPDRLPVARRWSRRHTDTQRRLCERFAAPVIAAVTCQDIRTAHTQAIVNAAPTAGEGDRVHRMLSALVTVGIDAGYLVNSRLAKVHWQAGNRPLPTPAASVAGESALWVDPAEIPSTTDVSGLGRALAARRRGDLHELMACTAAYTSLRWGELAALTIGQVCHARREINVNRKVVEVCGHLYVEVPKNRKFRRTIYPRHTPGGYPLADLVAARVEQAQAEQDNGANPEGLLFPAPSGRHWRSSNFNRRVPQPAYLQAGWRDADADADADGNGTWTWHSLRHVFCTTALFTWKLDPTDVSRMAGHANYRITLDMYVGATAGVLDRARAATE